MGELKESIAARIYDKIRNDITFGKFKPEEHLSEKFLSQKYRVSRALIREIIRQLVSHGYLTHEINKGVLVTKLSLEDVDIIYNILERCESFAAALLAKSKNTAHVKQLEFYCKKMEEQDIRLRYKVWEAMNDKFHGIVFRNCGSPILKNLIYNMRLRIYRVRMVKTEFERTKLYNSQHRKILEAIREGNESLAEKLMAHHLETARKNRLKMFREFNELF